MRKLTPEEAIDEILDRSRRIETRIVKGFESLGGQTLSTPPRWDHGTIQVPSPAVSLRDCLDTIPHDWPKGKPVVVKCKGDYLTTIAH